MVDLWDFAGQDEYSSWIPLFLSKRAIYLVVFDLSKGLENFNTFLQNANAETNMEQLLKWLGTVSCMGSPEQKGWSYLRPLVFLVGTHADWPYEDIRNVQVKIWKEISQTNFAHQVNFPPFSIDNTKGSSDEGIIALKLRIWEALKQEPYMGEQIPFR